jgi:hypothetical protein
LSRYRRIQRATLLRPWKSKTQIKKVLQASTSSLSAHSLSIWKRALTEGIHAYKYTDENKGDDRTDPSTREGVVGRHVSEDGEFGVRVEVAADEGLEERGEYAMLPPLGDRVEGDLTGVSAET